MQDWIEQLRKDQQPPRKLITAAQEKYLKDLGHTGPVPQDRKQAAQLIARLIDAKDLTKQNKKKTKAPRRRTPQQPKDNTPRIMHSKTYGPVDDPSCPF